MAIAFVQAWGGVPPNNATHGELVTSVTTGTLTTTTGNFIAVGVSHSVALTSISDSKTNAWTDSVGPIANGGDSNTQKHAMNITGGTLHTVSANLSGAGGYVALSAVEYSGLATTLALDKIQTNTGNSASLDSGTTAATTQNDELLMGSGTENLGPNITWTAGASFTKRSDCNLGASTSVVYLEERIVSSTGTYSAPCTSSDSDPWAADIATYKMAGGGAAPTVKTLSALGVG